MQSFRRASHMWDTRILVENNTDRKQAIEIPQR